MKSKLALATLASVVLTAGCDQPAAEAGKETEELLQKVAELEQAQEDAAEKRNSELARELAAAREELKVALAELEAQQAGEAEVAVTGEETVVDVEDAPRAVVVDEEPAIEVGLEVAEPAEEILDASDHQVFFVELARFGEWFETDEYGFVWQPREVRTDPDWRPYTRGRWVHSDQGWTWLSDEPFGWAVYHYGRWALLEDAGWVWIPGDDWAPAWVAWRQSDEYIGWAPLPPETLYDDNYAYDAGIDAAYGIGADYYSFVPLGSFHEPVFDHCVGPELVVNIVIHTTNVTNIWTRNRRVHCGGPDFAWVNRHVRRPIPHCRLDLHGGREHFAHRGRHRLHDDRLEIFAPRVDAPWNSAVRPPRVTRNLGDVHVVRGKGRMDREVVERFQRAVVQRHEAARQAMKGREAQQALQRNLERRRSFTQREGMIDRHRAQGDPVLREALQTADAAQRRLEEPNLNPKQRAYAEQAAKNAQERLQAARNLHEAQRVAERQGRLIERGDRGDGRRGPRALEPGGDGAEPEQRRRGEEAVRDESERARALAEQRGREREAMAQQEAERAEENRRAAAEAARRAEEVAADQAAERERAQTTETRREDLRRGLSSRQGSLRERAGRIADERREAAERAAAEQRRAEVAEQKQLAEASEQKRRAEAEGVRMAEQQRQAVEEAQRAAAQRAQLAEQQRQTAEEESRLDAQRQRDLAERQAAEDARRAKEAVVAQERARQEAQERARAAAEAQSRAEAARQATEGRQRAEAEAAKQAALERQRAEAAQRQADMRRQAEESRRQAEAKSRAAAEEANRRALHERAQEASRRRAEATQRQAQEAARQQALAEARQRAEQQRAQQEAAQRRAEQQRAQQEAAQRAQQEAARRAQQEAAQRAEQQRQQQEAQRRAQEAQQRAEEARRQQAEEARRQQQQQSRRQSPLRRDNSRGIGRGRR